MTQFDLDLFVIGAGSGGVRAARISARHGAKVAVAEEYRVGGTCVIRGCVPKKLFVYASQYAEAFEDGIGFGWTTEQVSFDWPTLLANKDKEIDRLNKIYIRNLEAAGVEIIPQRAVLKDAHTVQLADGSTRTARHILIATGATPFIPDVPGRELAITSNEAFHLEKLPRRIAIVGGGYIAVEFAGIFNGLGVETILIYRGDEILRGFDQDLRRQLTEEMKKKGVEIRTRSDVARIETSGDGVRLTLTDGAAFGAGAVMYATGRVPHSRGLGLEAAGVAVNETGAIRIDGYCRTSVPHIYAVGDVTDRTHQLTPVAIREGHAVADNLFAGKNVLVDHSNIPTAVFSQPEIGTVGMTEAEARATRAKVDIYKTSFRPMRHTLSGREERMLMKLVVDGETDRVLGCHILGPDAGEMAQLLGIAVKMGASKADFDATMAVHPTAAEELVTLREKWTG